jgi:predicted AAA+ superfamily ATPase
MPASDQTGANMLPGRSLLHRLFPLIFAERPAINLAAATSLVLPIPAAGGGSIFPAAGLEERLAYGDLPGVVLLDEANRPRILSTFATVYLEERPDARHWYATGEGSSTFCGWPPGNRATS